ncbi:hypothetical protein DTO271G3_2040 [Paecilomyces variotii]|nr:hypothetical protein DTO271G3_2040 [Paecilomyces variotii]
MLCRLVQHQAPELSPKESTAGWRKGSHGGRHIVLRSMNTLPQKPCLLNTLFLGVQEPPIVTRYQLLFSGGISAF